MPSSVKSQFLLSVFGLSALWLLLSGHYTPVLLVLGAISVALVAFIAMRMDVVDSESLPVELMPRAILPYWLWLLKQILLCDYAMCKIILSPTMPISPRILAVMTSQKTVIGRVTHANSITLTPGTVTIDVDHNETWVHALTAEAEADLRQGELNQRVCQLERP